MLKTKITAVLMALFVMVSTIGIAHVTHFCSMAISSMGQKSCEQAHQCCDPSDSTDDSCCIPVYKYYHSEIASVISKPMAPVTPAFSDLFFVSFSSSCIPSLQTLLFQPFSDQVTIPTGPDIRISSGSLLI